MALEPFSIYRPTGLGVRTRVLVKAAATNFKRGAPVIMTTGLAVEAGADPALNTIEGVSQSDMALSGYGATQCPVTRIDAGDHWIGSVDKSGTFGTGTTAVAQRGTRYGIARDATSGLWYVDIDDTTAVRVRVEALIDAVGTVQGRVEFSWIQHDQAL
jgi:hypothetical protein